MLVTGIPTAIKLLPMQSFPALGVQAFHLWTPMSVKGWKHFPVFPRLMMRDGLALGFLTHVGAACHGLWQVWDHVLKYRWSDPSLPSPFRHLCSLTLCSLSEASCPHPSAPQGVISGSNGPQRLFSSSLPAAHLWGGLSPGEDEAYEQEGLR